MTEPDKEFHVTELFAQRLTDLFPAGARMYAGLPGVVSVDTRKSIDGVETDQRIEVHMSPGFYEAVRQARREDDDAALESLLAHATDVTRTALGQPIEDDESGSFVIRVELPQPRTDRSDAEPD